MHIRNVPEQTRQLLAERAKQHGRSMNNEAIEVLKLGLSQKAVEQAALWREIDENASGLPEGTSAAELVREGREERERELDEWLRNRGGP